MTNKNKRFDIIGTQVIQTMRELCTTSIPDKDEISAILEELAKTMVALMEGTGASEFSSTFNTNDKVMLENNKYLVSIIKSN